MSPLTEQANALWPLLVYLLAVAGVIVAMLGVAWLLGQKHSGRATNQPYESGVIPVDNARLRFSAKFYLVAIFFVIFDLEVIFIFAWGVVVREAGWTGLIGAMVFIGVLTVALIYEWRIGALDWGPRPRRRTAASAETRLATES